MIGFEFLFTPSKWRAHAPYRATGVTRQRTVEGITSAAQAATMAIDRGAKFIGLSALFSVSGGIRPGAMLGRRWSVDATSTADVRELEMNDDTDLACIVYSSVGARQHDWLFEVVYNSRFAGNERAVIAATSERGTALQAMSRVLSRVTSQPFKREVARAWPGTERREELYWRGYADIRPIPRTLSKLGIFSVGGRTLEVLPHGGDTVATPATLFATLHEIDRQRARRRAPVRRSAR